MYINTFSAAMRKKFGCKVYKLSLSGGMTCPNRDGTLGERGCIFCSGAGEFAAPVCGDMSAQIEAAKAHVSFKAGDDCRYIAYFQDYTNTYAPVSYLEPLFASVIDRPDIAALSIATRPDCLPDNVIGLLARLRKKKPVWVELGLQTIHEKTAEYIRRGYDLPVFENAVKKLKCAGIEVVVHQIIGLPGETPEMIWQTAEYISASGADGIKLHLLYVCRDTDLAEDYTAGKFRTLEPDEYISLLEGCILRISPEVVIHRMTGDGAKKSLVAPLWSADKKKVLNMINSAFRRDNIIQGSLCRGERPFTAEFSRKGL